MVRRERQIRFLDCGGHPTHAKAFAFVSHTRAPFGEKFKTVLRAALLALPREGVLICLFDGCSHKTFNVVKSVSERRLRIDIGERKKSIVQARRTLIHLPRAKCVANLDADVIALPWRFKTPLGRLEGGGYDFV